jgi:hypothetical protein
MPGWAETMARASAVVGGPARADRLTPIQVMPPAFVHDLSCPSDGRHEEEGGIQ